MKDNFEKINFELSALISRFENDNGDLVSFVLNENDVYLHNMKMKGELFELIELDSEFEQTDLLDFLGYERIIACNKENKS